MIIYKVTNLVNNKMYIGQTRQKIPSRRFNSHIRESKNSKTTNSFHNAIKKYRKSNFKFEIICCSTNLDDLNYMESYFISLYKSNIKGIGYNLTSGGDCIALNQESIDKMSLTIRNQFKNGRKNWNKGLKYSLGLKTPKIIKDSLSIAAFKRGLTFQNSQSKNVLCIELGLIFKSATKAAIYFNTSQGCISNICRKERNSLKGLHFEYTNIDFNVNVLPDSLYKSGIE